MRFVIEQKINSEHLQLIESVTGAGQPGQFLSLAHTTMPLLEILILYTKSRFVIA